MQRPEATEHNPYFKAYIDLVPEGQFTYLLSQNSEAILTIGHQFSETDADYRYAPDKWSVKQVLMHIIDVERTMMNRVFVAARGDSQSPLFKMDDALYQTNANADSRSLKQLLEEFNLVRSHTAFFFRTLNKSHELLKANTSPVPVTIRALAYIIIGHAYHHLNIINERYLK